MELRPQNNKSANLQRFLIGGQPAVSLCVSLLLFASLDTLVVFVMCPAEMVAHTRITAQCNTTYRC